MIRASADEAGTERTEDAGRELVARLDARGRAVAAGEGAAIRIWHVALDDGQEHLGIEAEPSVAVPLHAHVGFDEAVHVLAGTLALTIGDRTLTLGAGAAAVVPAGVPRAWSVVGDVPARFFLVTALGAIERTLAQLEAFALSR